MVSPTTFSTASEIQDLIKLARLQRADALGEILSQKDEFISYFMALLNASPHSHPNTHRVLNTASLIALFVAMYFKGKFKRQRPAQLFPPLMPPSETPGHASYPSGHATQARLMARCMGFVLENALSATNAPIMQTNLNGLAARIAHNREIAGFHYASDSSNGALLADALFNQLKPFLVPATSTSTPSTMPFLNAAATGAYREWN